MSRCTDIERAMRPTSFRERARGATLIELITVITVTGVLIAGMAMMVNRPLEGYLDAARRAEITDTADTALRRMARDLRTALPNSVRITTDGLYVEFLPIVDGGRYRAQEAGAPPLGNILDFASAGGDGSFDVIGTAPAWTGTKEIVVYNLGPGFDPANAYVTSGTNNRAAASIAGSTVTLSIPKQFPQPSPGNRFFVIDGPVTYACAGGELRRISGYAIAATQAAPPAGTSNALLASGVTGCSFDYTALNQRTALVGLTLRIGDPVSGEGVRLFQQVRIDNVP